MNRQDWDLMNRALEGEADPEAWQAFIARLDNAPGDARLWGRMSDLDRLLRQEPMVAPPARFSAQVMAQVRLQAERSEQNNGFLLAIRLTIVALIGLAVILGLVLLLTRLFGPVDPEATLNQARALFASISNLLRLLADWAEEYPMLPAIGLASIPLAFATLWVVIYYTPKDRLQAFVQQRLTSSS